MMVLVANWWAFVLRGVIAVLFGLMAFFMPGMALLTLVFMFGFYSIADGIFNIIAAFQRAPSQQPWWALLISGILGIIAGLIALFIPGITAIVLLYIIAGWAIATGIMQIVAAVRLRKQIDGEWLLALSGVLSVVLGVLIAIFPGAGALTVVIWIGAYAFVFGILLISLGVKLRTLMKRASHDLHDFPPGAVAPGH
jgi:uncharacterized membrane protein HdeD (DUF308 family)